MTDTAISIMMHTRTLLMIIRHEAQFLAIKVADLLVNIIRPYVTGRCLIVSRSYR